MRHEWASGGNDEIKINRGPGALSKSKIPAYSQITWCNLKFVQVASHCGVLISLLQPLFSSKGPWEQEEHARCM